MQVSDTNSDMVSAGTGNGTIIKSTALNQLLWLLCLALPWSLLWVDNSLLFPFETSKAWLFRALVQTAFALFLIEKLIYRERSPFLPSEAKRNFKIISTQTLLHLLLGFLVLSGVSNMLGIDPFRSFWSNYERMAGFIAYLHWAMYLLCLLSALKTPRRQSQFLLNIIAVISLVCFMGLFDLEKRAISSLGNPLYLGNLAVFGFFICAYLMATLFVTLGVSHGYAPASLGQSKLFKFILSSLLLLSMGIMLAAIFKTAARGAAVALFAGLLIVLFTLLWQKLTFSLKNKRVIGLGILMLCLVFMGIVASQFPAVQTSLSESDHYLLQRLGKISMQDQTTADRLENWRIAIHAAQQYPWLGWGQENYTAAFNEHYQAGVIDKAKLWFDRAHNAYLDVLLAAGAGAFLWYIVILLFPILLIKSPQFTLLERSFLWAFFSAFMVKNIVGFDTFSSTLIWLSMLALLIVRLRQIPITQPLTKMPSSGVLGALASLSPLVIMSLLSLSLYQTVYLPYKENQRFSVLINAKYPFKSIALQQILAQENAGFRFGETAKMTVLNSVLRKSEDKAKRGLLSPGERRQREQLFQKTGSVVSDLLKQQPRKYRLKYNAANLLLKLGHANLAVSMLAELTQAAPQRAIFWQALGRAYAANNQPKQAQLARDKVAAIQAQTKR